MQRQIQKPKPQPVFHTNSNKNFIRQIQANKSIFIERISKRKTNHLVELNGDFFLVGYDKQTKRIATVLLAKRLEEVYAT